MAIPYPVCPNCVLMPCRALEAFRRTNKHQERRNMYTIVLMPCRALEAFRRRFKSPAPRSWAGGS